MAITLAEAPEFIRKKIAELVEKAQEVALPAAGNTMLAIYKDRIFADGKDSSGADIGSYSTTPMYASQKQFVNKGSFKGVGKNGDTKFTTGAKKGQTHKSMYLPVGVKQLRDIQGRPTSTKNYNYSGSLFNAVRLEKNGQGYAIVINEKKESIKLRANEKRDKKPVSAASENEIKVFEQSFVDHFKEETNKIFT